MLAFFGPDFGFYIFGSGPGSRSSVTFRDTRTHFCAQSPAINARQMYIQGWLAPGPVFGHFLAGFYRFRGLYVHAPVFVWPRFWLVFAPFLLIFELLDSTF
jgi:hypothetical protein